MISRMRCVSPARCASLWVCLAKTLATHCRGIIEPSRRVARNRSDRFSLIIAFNRQITMKRRESAFQSDNVHTRTQLAHPTDLAHKHIKFDESWRQPSLSDINIRVTCTARLRRARTYAHTKRTSSRHCESSTSRAFTRAQRANEIRYAKTQ